MMFFSFSCRNLTFFCRMLLVEVKEMKKIIFIILVLLIPIKINAYGYLEQPYSNDLWYMMSGGDKPVFSKLAA